MNGAVSMQDYRMHHLETPNVIHEIPFLSCTYNYKIANGKDLKKIHTTAYYRKEIGVNSDFGRQLP